MKTTALSVMLLAFGASASAQDIIGIITEGITKVIRAIDLEVQRVQTQTIVLQDAQKQLENALCETRLGEIRDWVQQQKDLYSEYFQELAQVKTVIADYHQVSGMITREEEILAAYQRGMANFQKDPHFTAAELSQIRALFTAILNESEQNLSQLTALIRPFTLQMTDQERMNLLDATSANMDRNYRDIITYTNQNELISLQRASDDKDYLTIKNLYRL
jgi:DNA repair ATPase RecN